MYSDLPLWLSLVFVVGGLWALTWSADKFIDGSSMVAKALGVSPFVIGMVIIGFGTSAPELCVSALSGLSGHSDLSLGNAYGSCTFNIAMILGVAALIRPIVVKPAVSFVAVPMMLGITLLSCLLVAGGNGFSRSDGVIQLAVFAVLLPVYCWFDQKSKPPQKDAPAESSASAPMWKAWMWLLIGLVVLVASSHFLVWGAVDLARALGVSELMIGLTIVAVGTSLPELASAVVSARKGEHEFVLGNIIGSNLFNTLAVVGLAGTIQPFKNVSPYILTRDMPTLLVLSLSIALFGVNWRSLRSDGGIGRFKGLVWILAFVAYSVVMFMQEYCR